MMNGHSFPCKCLGKSQYKYYHNSSYKTLCKFPCMCPSSHRTLSCILLCKSWSKSRSM